MEIEILMEWIRESIVAYSVGIPQDQPPIILYRCCTDGHDRGHARTGPFSGMWLASTLATRSWAKSVRAIIQDPPVKHSTDLIFSSCWGDT